jgi:chromosome segregation ATPase
MPLTSIVPGGNPPGPPQNGMNKMTMPGSRNPASKSGTFKGRKFVEVNHSASAEDVNSGKRGRKPNVDVNDLDKMLENDAAALQNMRKDIQKAQEAEMGKCRTNLSAMRKEYDTLCTTNTKYAHDIAELRDTKIILDGLVEGQQQSREKYLAIINDINDELKDVEDNIEAESRTKDMMSFVSNRLDAEIMDCKVKSHALTAAYTQLKSEYSGLESTLRLSRLELSGEERRVESLIKTVKDRSQQRQAKMSELQSMVMEGEDSITRVKMSMRATLDVSAIFIM